MSNNSAISTFMRHTVASKLSVLDTATRLTELGYLVVPVAAKSKQVSAPGWQHLRLSLKELPLTFAKPELGVGLLLGIEVAPGIFPVAIDIDTDDETLINNILHVFPSSPPAKRGSKGITFFAYVSSPVKKQVLKRKDATGSMQNCVELLAAGQQTVIPPSLHPNGNNYQWIGSALTDCHPNSLPPLTEDMLNEIKIAVKNPDQKIFAINTMTWLGENGGGSVHESVLAATGSFVALHFSDDYIWARVNRESRRAVEAFGEQYDWPGYEQKVREKIESAKKSGFETPSKKPNQVMQAAQWIMHKWQPEGRIYEREGSLLFYRDGYYKIMPDQKIRHALMTEYSIWTLEREQAQKAVNIALDTAEPFPMTESKKVCFSNGTYDIDKDSFADWSPDDFLIAHRPFEYDSNATAPLYEQVVERAFQHEGVQTADVVMAFEEFVSQTFFECLKYKKFLIIEGGKDTGKSLLIHLIKSLHYDDQVSNVSVSQFNSERAGVAMYGKLLNVSTEMEASMSTHVADAFLKAVVSGDPIMIRALFKEMQAVILPTRLIMACNEMFKTRDHSGAIESRMLWLKCDNEISVQERDPNLLGKLLPERPGIFNRMVKAWKILEREGGFPNIRYSDDPRQRFTKENDPIIQWYEDRTNEGLGIATKEGWTAVGDLYLDYVEWAKINGHKQMSSVSFGMRLSKIKVADHYIQLKFQKVGGIPVRLRNITLMTEGRKF